MLLHVAREYASLGDHLECVEVRAAFLAGKEHLAFRSYAEHAHHFEIRHSHPGQDTLLGAHGRARMLLVCAALVCVIRKEKILVQGP
jgi:hypothetical protein